MVCAGVSILGDAPSEFTEGQHKHAIEQPQCAEVGVKRLKGVGEFIEELKVRSTLCRVRVISFLYRVEDASTKSPFSSRAIRPSRWASADEG